MTNIFDATPTPERRMNIILQPLRPDDPHEEQVEIDVSEWDAERAVETLYSLQLECRDAEEREARIKALSARAGARYGQAVGALHETIRAFIESDSYGERKDALFATELHGLIRADVSNGLTMTALAADHGLLTIPAESSIAEKLRILLEAEQAADRLKQTAKLAAEAARAAVENHERLEAETKAELMQYAKAHPVPGKKYALLSLDQVGMPDVSVRLAWRAGTEYPQLDDEEALKAQFIGPLTTADVLSVSIPDDKGNVTLEPILRLIPARWQVDMTVLGKALRRGVQIAGAKLKPAVESLSIGRQG